MFLQDPLFWFTLCLILIIVEIFSSNKLYSMFFSIGSFVTALLAFVADDTYLLVPVFFSVSLILILIVKTPFSNEHVENSH